MMIWVITMENFHESYEGKPPKQCGGMIHVIKEGDTLYKIAQMYEVAVLDLMLANPYINIYNLQIGDEICVPVKNIGMQNNNIPYIVAPGDTVKTILQTTKLSFEELAKNNPFLYELLLPEKAVLFLPAKK